MVPPPLGGPARAFSTTSARKWQYTYNQALTVAGPSLLKKKTRTQVNTTAGSETMRMPLPMALRIQAPPQDKLPDISRTDEGKRLLKSYVANIKDLEHQDPMETEADVIQVAGPYFLKVVEDLAPIYLASCGLRKDFTIQREAKKDKSRPDVVMKYDGKAILALDWKGPNCIFREELELCSADSVSAAQRLLQPQGEAPDTKKKGKGLKRPSDRDKSLCYGNGVNQFTQALLKQGIKYRVKFEAPVVVFYDYEHLMIMEPPLNLEPENNRLMDVVLCSESSKSKEGNLVALTDNHVNVLLRYILTAVKKHG